MVSIARVRRYQLGQSTCGDDARIDAQLAADRGHDPVHLSAEAVDEP